MLSIIVTSAITGLTLKANLEATMKYIMKELDTPDICAIIKHNRLSLAVCNYKTEFKFNNHKKTLH